MRLKQTPQVRADRKATAMRLKRARKAKRQTDRVLIVAADAAGRPTRILRDLLIDRTPLEQAFCPGGIRIVSEGWE